MLHFQSAHRQREMTAIFFYKILGSETKRLSCEDLKQQPCVHGVLNYAFTIPIKSRNLNLENLIFKGLCLEA